MASKALRSDFETQWLEVSEELCFYWHRPPLEVVEQQSEDSDTVRIFLNGCFDLMHVGHFNALRQAKSLFFQQGYKKVVMVAGIHSDEAISRQKGPPMMSDDERIAVLQATKWVDELVTALPYVSMSAKMADALRVKWICHGDDMPVCRGGGGMYSDAIEQNRFQLLKRTEGISTTQIVERLIQLQGSSSCQNKVGALESALATTQRLAQFAAPADLRQAPRLLSAAKRVVYVAGVFDLLHPGHVTLLEHAAKLGDYLLVGLYSDDTVRLQRGALPVLTLLERAMAVLSLRWVDDVVLGAPWEISKDLLSTMNVAVIAVGRHKAQSDGARDASREKQLRQPRALGIVHEVDTSCDISVEGLKQRFLARSDELLERNSKLLKKEHAYVESKGYVPEA